jgi:hypothetical protein
MFCLFCLFLGKLLLWRVLNKENGLLSNAWVLYTNLWLMYLLSTMPVFMSGEEIPLRFYTAPAAIAFVGILLYFDEVLLRKDSVRYLFFVSCLSVAVIWNVVVTFFFWFFCA